MAMTGGTAKHVATGYNSGNTSWPIKIYVYYKISQDIAKNQSTISLGMYFTQTTGSIGSWYGNTCYVGTKSMTFNGDIPNTSASTYWLVENKTMTVNHNADGTGSTTIYWQWGCVSSWAKLNAPHGSFNLTLPTIPRGATITAAPDFTDEQNPTITFSNPAGSAVSALDACISFDGSKDDISYRAISKTGTTYTFNLTDAERNILRNGTTSNSRTVRFYVRTTIGSNQFWSYLTKTLTLVNHKPTLNPSITITDSTTASLTGNSTSLIKGHTTISVSTGAAARKGASLTSQKITNGTATINSGSGTINGPTSGSFTFSATDSRGNTTTQTVTRTLINYVKPTCNISVKMTADGVATINITGNIFNGSFGSTQNTLAVQYRYKEAGASSWGSWTGAGTGTKDGNTYSASPQKTGLDYRKVYTFQARAYDKLYTVESGQETITALPVFDWSDEDFRFNVPVVFAAGYSQVTSSIDDTPIETADFIVESGTSGNWTYRKWNSGIAECWARIAVNTAVSTQWGGLYVSGSLSATNLTFPFTFTAIPMINANLSGSGSGAFLIASGSASSSTTKTGIYEIARGSASSTATNYAINFDVRGRWK